MQNFENKIFSNLSLFFFCQNPSHSPSWLQNQRLVDRAGSCSPSRGSGQRGWNLSLERWGEKVSVGVSIVPGAGGWEGSLVPQITRPLAAIVAEWKEPIGGSHGWGDNSAQWSVGEKGPCLSRDSGVGGVLGVYTVVSHRFVDSCCRKML